jgi:hypothetical protein
MSRNHPLNATVGRQAFLCSTNFTTDSEKMKKKFRGKYVVTQNFLSRMWKSRMIVSRAVNSRLATLSDDASAPIQSWSERRTTSQGQFERPGQEIAIHFEITRK